MPKIEKRLKMYKQQGAGLLIVIAILILTSLSILMKQLDHTDLMLSRQAKTEQALAQAKTALLGYAAAYSDTHSGRPMGFLPCPDTDGDGSGDVSCGITGHTVLGRLPWRTLGLPPLRDGAGECLWYAVSGTYKNHPPSFLTSDTDGLLIVKNQDDQFITGNDENDTINHAIAIVFAPGEALKALNQNRTLPTDSLCGDNLDPRDYLDYLTNLPNINNATGSNTLVSITSNGHYQTVNKTDTSTFIAAPLTKNNDGNIAFSTPPLTTQSARGHTIFNDRLAIITPKDYEFIYRRMNEWVVDKVKTCFENYANSYQYLSGDTNNKYPWATDVSADDFKDDTNIDFGRIPFSPLLETKTDNNDMPEWWSIDGSFNHGDAFPEILFNSDTKPKDETLAELVEPLQKKYYQIGSVRLDMKEIEDRQEELAEEGFSLSKEDEDNYAELTDELYTLKDFRKDTKDLLTKLLINIENHYYFAYPDWTTIQQMLTYENNNDDVSQINILRNIFNIEFETEFLAGFNDIESSMQNILLLQLKESVHRINNAFNTLNTQLHLQSLSLVDDYDRKEIVDLLRSYLQEYRCFNENTSIIGRWNWSWWKNWKDMVFYKINHDNAPQINGSGQLTLGTQNAELVVVVAGRRLMTTDIAQTRDNTGEKNIINYLEEDNTNLSDAIFTNSLVPAKQGFNPEFNDIAVSIPEN